MKPLFKIIKSYYFEVIEYMVLFIFLFSVVDKIINFSEFHVRFARIEIISQYKLWYFSVGIIGMEILGITLFLIDKFRLLGLYVFFSLLFIFSIHLFQIISNNADACSCGGIFDFISLPQHLLVNIICLVLLIFSIWRRESGYTIGA